MAVTALATIVKALIAEPTRPGYVGASNQGWNNRVGDPHWIEDYDYYRRIQLVAQGTLGEVGGIVNWELYDESVIQFKTQIEIDAYTTPAVAGPKPYFNNSTTWTLWVNTGSVAGATPKYRETGQPPFSQLRANGPRVQVLLGPAKKVGGTATQWTVAAFLPGAGKKPSATTTVTVTPPTLAVMPQQAGGTRMSENTPSQLPTDPTEPPTVPTVPPVEPAPVKPGKPTKEEKEEEKAAAKAERDAEKAQREAEREARKADNKPHVEPR